MYQLIRVNKNGSIHVDMDTDDNLELIESYYNINRSNPSVIGMMLVYIDPVTAEGEVLVSYIGGDE